jgi:hypothetical protein
MSDADLLAFLQEQKPENLLPILNSLPPARTASLPMHMIVANNPTAENALRQLVTSALQSLLYPSGSDGVRQFQLDIGDKPTGTITFGEFSKLGARIVRHQEMRVYGFGRAQVSIDSDFALAKGSWVSDWDDFPINSTKISCSREEHTCTLIEAEVKVPSVDDDDATYRVFSYSEEYHVVSWDKDVVVARRSIDCGVGMLTLNTKPSEVTMKVYGSGECKHAGISRLVPAQEAGDKFWSARAKKTCSYLNSALPADLRRAPILNGMNYWCDRAREDKASDNQYHLSVIMDRPIKCDLIDS